MTKDDVVRIGREVGLPHWYDTKGLVNEKQLIKFANRIAKHEREACAKICDDLWEDDYTAYACAEAIRKRAKP